MMKHQIFKALFAVAAMFTVLVAPVHAEVKLDIRRGAVEPMPIAVSDMVSNDELGAQISQVIAADLKRSGFFLPVDKAAFIQKITNPDAAPRFEDWKAVNAQALVSGRVTKEADGRLRAEFRLWDVYGGTQLIGQWRRRLSAR